MKNIAFTICSNNYLAQAKVLSDSVYEYSKECYDFYIVLCDEFCDRIDYSEFHATFVLAKDLGIWNFDWMTKRYNIIELNTAIKPSAFKYLISKYSPEYIHYLDPDICTYCSLNVIEKEMQSETSILLTPHSLAPLPFDGGIPTDNIFLNNGIYNLGFLGLKVDENSSEMLEWWCDFLSEHCIDEKHNGFFVDQLPMELVPIFFKKVKVSYHKGLNVAYWNLHERSIKQVGNCYRVDEKWPLVFFHFSSYNLNKPQEICRHSSRIVLSEYPALDSLFKDYYKKMRQTKDGLYKTIGCVYAKPQLIVMFLSKVSTALRLMAEKVNLLRVHIAMR